MNITKYLQQTAVYWGNPQPNGTGGYAFDDPIEINCRWSDRRERLIDKSGLEIISRSKILAEQRLDEEGYLYLGNLSDLSTEEQANPLLVDNAYQIRVTNMIPDLFANNYIYKAWT